LSRGPSPASLALAADAGAFAALGGQDAGIAGVGVASGQVVLQLTGQDGMAGVVRAAHNKGAEQPELGLGLAQDAFVGVKHTSTLACTAQRRMAGVLFADRLSRIT